MDLKAALNTLTAAVQRAVPSSERCAAAKRAVLSELLRKGLIPFGGAGVVGVYRHLPLLLLGQLGADVLFKV